MKTVDFLDGSEFLAVAKHAKPSILKGIISAFPEVAKKYKVKPVHAALMFGQIAVESDHFKTMEEYASGNAYDTRTDLGNTPERDGDGALNKGAGLIQRTGHTNLSISAKRYGMTMNQIRHALKNDPELALDDAAHYCMIERGRQMAAAVKQNSIKILTKAVNGGYNHHTERVRYTRLFMLSYLGFATDFGGIKNFQQSTRFYPGKIDGAMGPQTEEALWQEIKQCGWAYPVGPSPIQKVTNEVDTKTVAVSVGATGIGAALVAIWQWLFGG